MKTTLLALTGIVLFLSSCSKTETPVPVEVAISKIEIVSMPLTDGGSSWDVGSDADVYFKISNYSTTLYDHPSYVENVNSGSLPLSFDINATYVLPLINQEYTIGLYDYDQTSGNDFIGSLSFNPNDYKADANTQVVISNVNCKIKVYLTWKY